MFHRLAAALERATYAATGALLAGITIVIGWQVFSRKVLHSTPYWSEEIARFAMMWMGLVGAAVGVRAGSHITVDFFARLLGQRAAGTFALFAKAAQALFALFLIRYGFGLCTEFASETAPATRMPMGLIYAAVPLAGLLMLVFLSAGSQPEKDP